MGFAPTKRLKIGFWSYLKELGVVNEDFFHCEKIAYYMEEVFYQRWLEDFAKEAVDLLDAVHSK